jgi:hypothetical protein
MGFRFDRQLHLHSSTIQKYVKRYKTKEKKQDKFIHSPDTRRKAQQQLSTQDYKFLQSIGLRVKNDNYNDDD